MLKTKNEEFSQEVPRFRLLLFVKARVVYRLQMNESRESFRKIGLTFEEKAFYDILVSLRGQYNFEYGEDKVIGGMIVNDRYKILAKKACK